MSKILELQETVADTSGTAAFPCISILTTLDCF
jgi:hypothetical protein